MMYEDKERQEYLKKLKAFATELINDTEKSNSLLQNAGIITKTGKLTKQYRDMSVSCVSYSE